MFRETTNPAVATGDGVALAYHAGARVADLEFVQFHPDRAQQAGRAPISDLRSAARRRRATRQRARRARSWRAITRPAISRRAMSSRGRSCAKPKRPADPSFLTLAHLDAEQVRRRFPTIAEMCRQLGLDLARDPIPVGPAAHYLMGGIDTDEWGRTSLPGLFAAGETACTGVHGANRLASNSLLEGLVFGARAAEAMCLDLRAGDAPARSCFGR